MVSFKFNRSPRTLEIEGGQSDNYEEDTLAQLEEKRANNAEAARRQQEQRLALLAMKAANGPGVISSRESNEINNQVRYGAE